MNNSSNFKDINLVMPTSQVFFYIHTIKPFRFSLEDPVCHFKENEALLLDLICRISTSTGIVSTAHRMSERRKTSGKKKQVTCSVH